MADVDRDASPRWASNVASSIGAAQRGQSTGNRFDVTEFATMRHLFLVAAILLVAVPAQAQSAPAPSRVEGPDGAAVFQKACASCHANPAPDSRAPTREVLRTVAPEAILTALTVGNMFRQGSELTDAERRAVAAFLAGRPVGHGAARRQSSAAARRSRHRFRHRRSIADWNGWGADAANTRFQPAAKAGLNATSMPRAEVEMGVRLCRRQLGAHRSPRSSAGACSSPARAAMSSRSTRRRGCTSLDATTRRPASAPRSRVGPYKTATDERLRGVLRGRHARSPTRSMRTPAREILVAQGRRPYLRARDRLAHASINGRVYVPTGRRRRRRPGRNRALRVLHVPRQRVGARCHRPEPWSGSRTRSPTSRSRARKNA